MAHKNVYEAMNAVMQEVGYVQKQKSANLNYSYAGEAALIAAIRPAMVAQGIVVHPAGLRELTTDQFNNAKGTLMTRVTGIFAFTFYHGETETGFTVEVAGEGVDSGDKAANKAMTAAYKYALRQSLMIETGDDPDKTPSSEYERHEGYSKPAPVKQPAQAATTGPTFPPSDAVISELDGASLYALNTFGGNYVGITEPKHFQNKWKKIYAVTNIKDIPGTVGEFIDRMGLPTE